MFTKFSPCLQLIFKCYINIFNGKTKDPCPKKKSKVERYSELYSGGSQVTSGLRCRHVKDSWLLLTK